MATNRKETWQLQKHVLFVRGKFCNKVHLLRLPRVKEAVAYFIHFITRLLLINVSTLHRVNVA